MNLNSLDDPLVLKEIIAILLQRLGGQTVITGQQSFDLGPHELRFFELTGDAEQALGLVVVTLKGTQQ